jgi:hypothetical protein
MEAVFAIDDGSMIEDGGGCCHGGYLLKIEMAPGMGACRKLLRTYEFYSEVCQISGGVTANGLLWPLFSVKNKFT